MSNHSLLIRPATESDAQRAFELMTDLGYSDLSLARFTQTCQSVLKNPAMMLMLAEDGDGEVIGLASISHRPQLRFSGDIMSIDELVVADSARGRGVGRDLLNAVKAIAEKMGVRRLELETSRKRESYRREFYIKNGFTEADSAVMRIDYELGDGR